MLLLLAANGAAAASKRYERPIPWSWSSGFSGGVGGAVGRSSAVDFLLERGNVFVLKTERKLFDSRSVSEVLVSEVVEDALELVDGVGEGGKVEKR